MRRNAMAEFFNAEYALFWTVAMALALFFPVRRLIWVLYVRRAERDGEEDSGRRQRLHRRATATGALLSIVFAYFYIAWLFRDSG